VAGDLIMIALIVGIAAQALPCEAGNLSILSSFIGFRRLPIKIGHLRPTPRVRQELRRDDPHTCGLQLVPDCASRDAYRGYDVYKVVIPAVGNLSAEFF
jgi:hypothetical protein